MSKAHSNGFPSKIHFIVVEGDSTIGPYKAKPILQLNKIIGYGRGPAEIVVFELQNDNTYKLK